MLRVLRRSFGLVQVGPSSFEGCTDLRELNAHLAQRAATFSVVYFRADWNPECAEADGHFQRLTETSGLECYKVDSDQAEVIRTHYRVRAEPEFVLCFYGDELIRHIGVDQPLLQRRVEKMLQFAKTADWEEVPEAKRWVPYATRWQAYYRDYYKRLKVDHFSLF